MVLIHTLDICNDKHSKYRSKDGTRKNTDIDER